MLILVHTNSVRDLVFSKLGNFIVTSSLTLLPENRMFFGSESGDSAVYIVNVLLDDDGNYTGNLNATQYIQNYGPIRDIVALNYFDRVRVFTASGKKKDCTLRVIEHAIWPKEHYQVQRGDNVIDIFSLKCSPLPSAVDQVFLLSTNTKTDTYRVNRQTVQHVELGFLKERTIAAGDVREMATAIQVTQTDLHMVVGNLSRSHTVKAGKIIDYAVVKGQMQKVITLSDNILTLWSIIIRPNQDEYRFHRLATCELPSKGTCLDAVTTEEGHLYIVVGFDSSPYLKVIVLDDDKLVEFYDVPTNPQLAHPISVVASEFELIVAFASGVYVYTQVDIKTTSYEANFIVPGYRRPMRLHHLHSNEFVYAASDCDMSMEMEGFLIQKSAGSYDFPAIRAKSLCAFEGSYFRNTVLLSSCNTVTISTLSTNSKKVDIKEECRKLAVDPKSQTVVLLTARGGPIPYDPVCLSIWSVARGDNLVGNVQRETLRNPGKDAEWTMDERKVVTTLVFLHDKLLRTTYAFTAGPYEHFYDVICGWSPIHGKPVYVTTVGLQYPGLETFGYLAVLAPISEIAFGEFAKYEVSHRGAPTSLAFVNGVVTAGFGTHVHLLRLEFVNSQDESQGCRLVLITDATAAGITTGPAAPEMPGTVFASKSTSSLHLLEGGLQPSDSLAHLMPSGMISTTSVIGCGDTKSIYSFGAQIGNGRSTVNQQSNGLYFVGTPITTFHQSATLHYMFPETMTHESAGMSLLYGTISGHAGWITRLPIEWSDLLRAVENALDNSPIYEDIGYLHTNRFEYRQENAYAENFIDGEKFDLLMSMDQSDALRILAGVDISGKVFEDFNIANTMQLYTILFTVFNTYKLHFKKYTYFIDDIPRRAIH